MFSNFKINLKDVFLFFIFSGVTFVCNTSHEVLTLNDAMKEADKNILRSGGRNSKERQRREQNGKH